MVLTAKGIIIFIYTPTVPPPAIRSCVNFIRLYYIEGKKH